MRRALTAKIKIAQKELGLDDGYLSRGVGAW